MRQYQLESLAFLVHAFDHGFGAILGDEMGLGKTLQTIAFLAHLHFEQDVSGPFLVVCPLTVLDSWANEVRRWCPDFRVLRLHTNDPVERIRLRRELKNMGFNVVITTYESIKKQKMETHLQPHRFPCSCR